MLKRICTICKIELDLNAENFYKSKDTFRKCCKSCSNKYSKKSNKIWIEKNKKIRNEYLKSYYEKNKETQLNKRKERYDSNRMLEIERNRKYIPTFFTQEALTELKTLYDKSGLYKMYNKEKKLIYIGKSYCLAKRIVESQRKRESYYFSYKVIENKADIDIYEVYYITKYRPMKNTEFNNGFKPTLELQELEFSPIIQII